MAINQPDLTGDLTGGTRSGVPGGVNTPATPTVPAILTKADWDKQKGVIAKIGVGETGIGAQMDKVKAAYAAVSWNKFNAKMVFAEDPTDPALVDQALKAAMAEFAKVEKVRAELRVLEGLAKKAQAAFKSKPLIPKSSTEHAGKIATEADHMAVALKSMDAEFKSFEEMKKQIANRVAMGRKALLSYMAKMPPAIAKLESKPDLEEYNDFHKELVRGLSAGLSRQKDLAALLPPWTQFSSDGFKPKTVQEIKPKLALIKVQLAKLQSALK